MALQLGPVTILHLAIHAGLVVVVSRIFTLVVRVDILFKTEHFLGAVQVDHHWLCLSIRLRFLRLSALQVVGHDRVAMPLYADFIFGVDNCVKTDLFVICIPVITGLFVFEVGNARLNQVGKDRLSWDFFGPSFIVEIFSGDIRLLCRHYVLHLLVHVDSHGDVHVLDTKRLLPLVD